MLFSFCFVIYSFVYFVGIILRPNICVLCETERGAPLGGNLRLFPCLVPAVPFDLDLPIRIAVLERQRSTKRYEALADFSGYIQISQIALRFAQSTVIRIGRSRRNRTATGLTTNFRWKLLQKNVTEKWKISRYVRLW